MNSGNNRTVDGNEMLTNPVPNAVVLAEATDLAQHAAVCVAASGLIVLCMTVFSIIAAFIIDMPDLVFLFINGVVAVFTVGFILSCCFLVLAVQIQNTYAENVASGNLPAV